MTELAFDPKDHDFVRNPYPRYALIREAPDDYRGEFGQRFLARYADVLAAVRDPRLSSNPMHGEIASARRERFADMPMFGEGGPQIMLTADPPDHTRLRRLASKAFTPRAVEALRPRVRELVEGMLDHAAERGSLDLMHDVAEPLPVIVICELLGVPLADQDQFKPWSTVIARTLDATEPEQALEAMPAILGFVQYFAELIEERRARPTDDVLSALVAAEAEGERLDLPELFAMIILLFVAGHETTTNLLGNGTLALLRHRDQFDALRADPGLATAATEELLRYDAPVQVTARTATEDVDLNGITLRKGEAVICGLAAANRDPRYVADPDDLRLARGAPTHVSFSQGMHHCLGAPLARLEGQVTFEALTRRFPGLQLATDDPPYRDHFVLRGLASLPLSLT